MAKKKRYTKNNKNYQTQKKEKRMKVTVLGDPDCYVFFNIQMTGLSKDADIISLGLIDIKGNSFYAEFTDYDKSKCSQWVIDNIVNGKNVLTAPETRIESSNSTEEPTTCTVTSDRKTINEELWKWLEAKGKKIQFVGDCSNHGFVLLLDLLLNDPTKTVIDLPTWISTVLYDINHTLSTFYMAEVPENTMPSDWSYEENDIPILNAFNLNRREIYSIKNEAEKFMMTSNEVENYRYHAISEAKIIRAIFRIIWSI